ncbi:unnamed protein product, partial [marine sediment metagenome]
TYYIKIQNDGNDTEKFTVTSTTLDPTRWTISYYDEGGSPIVYGEITGAGWLTPEIAPAGGSITITLYVTPNEIPWAGESEDILITSVSATGEGDAVKCVTTVKLHAQPDNLIKKEGDAVYQYGDDHDPTDQLYLPDPVTISNNTTLTYYIWIENDGNANQDFAVSGTGSAGGWTVSYYKSPYDPIADDITTAVVSGTYQATDLDPIPGVKEIIRVWVTAGATLDGGDERTVVIQSIAPASVATDTVKVRHQVDIAYKV